MVRNHLVPSIKSLWLAGPRLLSMRFRGAQRDLTVVVAHAPTAAAPAEERDSFYEILDELTSSISNDDTTIVLIDANAGPGVSRQDREHIVGPHGIPYPRNKDNAASCDAFSEYCYNHSLCIGHTWFAHKLRHKFTFYPNADHTGHPRDMDHVLIDGRHSSDLMDVRTVVTADISTSGTYVNEELAGHRAVLAKLRCRLCSREGNVPRPDYVRADCTKKDIKARIADTLKSEVNPKVLANNALISAGHFGLVPDCRMIPPDPETEVPPDVLCTAIDNLVDAGQSAVLAAAAQHAPALPKEKRFKKQWTTERTRQLSILRGQMLHTRQRIRTIGRNTLVKAAFETLRAWRPLQLYNRRAKKGTQGVPAPPESRAPRTKVTTQGAIWRIKNVGFRVLYKHLVFIVDSLFSLMTGKIKKCAHLDRMAHWHAESETLRQMAAAGRTRDLFQQIRVYAGKRSPAGILFLKDANGKALTSPEDRMTEWTREFKARFNPQVRVQYPCTAEESDEEWQDDSRDDDATSSLPEEREQQKLAARSSILPGHSTLLVTPSREEVAKGLMSAKLNRSPGADGITAELVRAALDWLVIWFIMIWKWTVVAAHVAQTWKDGVIINLV